MRPDLDAYNDMQLPPLEQTAIADLNERSPRPENGRRDTDHPRPVASATS